MLVVSEGNVWSDEHVILDSDTSGNENKWSDFAVVSYYYAFFDVNVGVDFAVFAHFALEKVNLVEYFCAFAYVCTRYHGVLGFFLGVLH
jgi:hypothetical protein